MTDDQDEVSERSLGIHNNESITVAEQFGPAILSIPKYIREEADKLLKPSEINVNEIYNFGNTKASWILPTSYQQYLKFIPPNVSIFYDIIIYVYILHRFIVFNVLNGNHQL